MTHKTPTGSLIITSKDGIKMVTGITKAKGNYLKLRVTVAGKTNIKTIREEDGLLYDTPLPLYTIDIKKISKIDNIDNRALYYINEEDILRVSV
jgi:hypothetical protein